LVWKSFQLLVVLAWLGSTALLVRKNYFPDTGRFPRVENALVSELFFERGQTSDLLLLVPGQGALGRVTVTARRFSVRLADAGFGTDTGELFFTGRFDAARLGGPTAMLGDVIWNGSLFLSRELETRGLRLQVRVPQLSLAGQLVTEADREDAAFVLKQNGKTLFDSRDPEGSRTALSLMGRMAGVEVPQPENLSDLGQVLRELEPTILCRHGAFSILGRRYDGYIVHVRWAPEAEVRFLVTELGELLRLEGVPNLDILGESFVPRELMEEDEEVDDS